MSTTFSATPAPRRIGAIIGAITAACTAVLLLSGSAATPSGLATYVLPADWSSGAGLRVGILAFSDGCVRLEDGLIPAFPASSTSWDGTTLVVGDEEYRVGDEIALGGPGPDVTPTIPAACGDGEVFIVGPPRAASPFDDQQPFPPDR